MQITNTFGVFKTCNYKLVILCKFSIHNMIFYIKIFKNKIYLK